MGSPIVFHTAPPQPASNARMICSPQLVGGAEASQNGLGELILPAKRTERSGAPDLGAGINRLQGLRNSDRSALAVRNRVHHLAPAVDAVAAREIFRIGGLPGSAVYLHLPIFYANAAAFFQKFQQRRLANRRNNRIASNGKVGILDGLERPSPGEPRAHTFKRCDAIPVRAAVNAHRLSEP